MARDDQRIEVLLEMHRYNTDLGKSYLEYRERLTQVVMYIYAALFTLCFAVGLEPFGIPFAVLLIVVGRFSERFILKFYERSEYHFCRARHLRMRLDQELGGSPIADTFAEALDDHRSNFKVKGRHGWRAAIISDNTHARWAMLHRMFSLTGWVLLFAMLANAVLCQFLGVCLVTSNLRETLSGLFQVN